MLLFFLLASVFMYCFKLRGLKPALCYVVPGMAEGREWYASTLSPVAAMQKRPWHGMAWRGVLAQHRKLATCEDRRMTTSKHHGITESQHESSDFKTKQQQCTRTTSKQHNPYMHVCPRARMYVSMCVCTHVCMSACVYIFVCAICLNVFGGSLILIQQVAWSAVGQDPIQSKFAAKKTSVFLLPICYYNNRNERKKTEVPFFDTPYTLLNKKPPFRGLLENGGFL